MQLIRVSVYGPVRRRTVRGGKIMLIRVRTRRLSIIEELGSGLLGRNADGRASVREVKRRVKHGHDAKDALAGSR